MNHNDFEKLAREATESPQSYTIVEVMFAQAVLDLIAENKRLQDEVKDIGTAAYLYAKHEGRKGET